MRYNRDIKSLIATRKKLIEQMPSWSEIVRGSLMNYMTKCGNKGCQCHKDKKYRHGPYTYLVVHKGKGKQRLHLISKTDIEEVKRARKAYDKLWEGLIKIAELNLMIIKAKGKANAKNSTTKSNKTKDK